MSQDQPLSNKTVQENDFQALCSLVVEEEGKTFTLVSNQFKQILKREPRWQEWIASKKEFSTDWKILQLIEENHWEAIEQSYQKIMVRGEDHLDLEEGLFLLSSFSDGKIKREEIAEPLDQMAGELTAVLSGTADVDVMIELFKQYLFEKKGFRGNAAQYYDPDNSYLHKVLERRTGIPVSISSVCLLLARRIRWNDQPIPVFGIGLPGHFVIEFRFGERRVFFDPFHRGKILSRKDCIEILRNHDIAFRESYLDPVNDHAIVCRTITNLIQIYTDLREERKSNQLLTYLQILTGEAETPIHAI